MVEPDDSVQVFGPPLERVRAYLEGPGNDQVDVAGLGVSRVHSWAEEQGKA